MIHAVVNAILAIEKPEKFRASTGFKATQFFTLLYEIAFTNSRIIASLDFISAVQYMIHFIFISLRL